MAQLTVTKEFANDLVLNKEGELNFNTWPNMKYDSRLELLVKDTNKKFEVAIVSIDRNVKPHKVQVVLVK